MDCCLRVSDFDLGRLFLGAVLYLQGMVYVELWNTLYEMWWTLW